jgi:5-methyltetrahydropteroyltriglutamate--homocysteine methyltransferase
LIEAYQHGIYPRSEEVVAATRGLERGRTSPDEVDVQFKRDREDLVQAQQEAGLDYFSDGLLRWQDIFRPLVEATEGMQARTLVRWFDNNSFFRAPEPPAGAEVRLRTPLPAVFDDYADVPEPRVATLPAPFTFSRAAQTNRDRNELMLEVARNVLRPVAQALAARGYGIVHLQEPWLVYFGIDEADWKPLEEALGGIRDGLAGSGAALVLHTYFGDAAPHADRLRGLPVDAIGFDFVQTDPEALGTDWPIGVLAGVLDGRSSPIEPVDQIVEFVRQISETLAPTGLYLSSNCELEFLPRDVARQKVLRLGEASARLKELLA